LNSKTRQIFLWLLIISSALVVVYFLQSKQASPQEELTLDTVITKIQNKQVRQVNFKQDRIEVVDLNNKTEFATVGEATKGELVKVINEHNKANQTSLVKYTEEPPSSGMGWLLLVATRLSASANRRPSSLTTSRSA